MEFEKYLRGAFIVLGLFFLFLLLFFLKDNLQLLFAYGFSVELPHSLSAIILTFVLTYIFLSIAISWKNIFKRVTKLLVSLATICMTFFFVFLVVNSNLEDLTDSMQPTIDVILVSQFKSLIEERLIQNPGEIVEVIISENSHIEAFYVNNLTKTQIDFFMDRNTQELDLQTKVDFVEVFISYIYDELEKNGAENSVLSYSFLESQIGAYGFSIQDATREDVESLKELIEVREEAYLRLSFSDNEEIIEVQIGNLSYEEIQLISNNLQLNQNLSNGTKGVIINVLLSVSKDQLGPQEGAIPVSTVGSMIPEDFKVFMDYDVFSENVSFAATEFSELRENCNYDGEEDFCEVLNLTLYDNLMAEFSSMDENSNGSLNIELPINITAISTIDDVEKKIGKTTDKYYLFLLLSIFFLILANLIYYLHFRLFGRELIIEHIPYFIIKKHMISLFVSFCFTLLVYFLVFKSSILENILNSILPPEIDFPPFTSMPFFNEISSIFLTVILTVGLYLLLIIVIYGVLFYLLKKKIGESELNH